MKTIEIGLSYDSENVVVSDEQTVREVFAEAGKETLLGSGYTVALLRANSRSIAIGDTSKTMGELGVQDGDSIIVTPNHKSAK